MSESANDVPKLRVKDLCAGYGRNEVLHPLNANRHIVKLKALNLSHNRVFTQGHECFADDWLINGVDPPDVIKLRKCRR